MGGAGHCFDRGRQTADNAEGLGVGMKENQPLGGGSEGNMMKIKTFYVPGKHL